MLLKKNRVKPLYKQFFHLRENVQNRTKLLKFKKKKWSSFLIQYLKQLKRFNKFKLKDQTRYIVTKYSNKGTSYKKQFKQSLVARKKFKLFYGNLSNTLIKKQIDYVLKDNKTNSSIHTNFIELFETRLDTVLFRSKFSKSFRDARQLISHGKVLVNKLVVRSPSYKLKLGDLISINSKDLELFEKNLKYCIKNNIENKMGIWPLPPKHLIINYKTMEIFFGKIQPTNFETEFFFSLNLEKILTNYYSH